MADGAKVIERLKDGAIIRTEYQRNVTYNVRWWHGGWGTPRGTEEALRAALKQAGIYHPLEDGEVEKYGGRYR